jgi:hypothetical protein
MKWLMELIFGKNGFNRKANDAVVAEIQTKTDISMDQTKVNMNRVGAAFNELIDTKEIVPEDPRAAKQET